VLENDAVVLPHLAEVLRKIRVQPPTVAPEAAEAIAGECGLAQSSAHRGLCADTHRLMLTELHWLDTAASRQLLDGEATEEVDEVTSVLPKNLRGPSLALLGGCEDEHIQVTIAECLLILMPRLQLLIARAKTVRHPEHAADQA
jgi:hypothetical protein